MRRVVIPVTMLSAGVHSVIPVGIMMRVSATVRALVHAHCLCHARPGGSEERDGQDNHSGNRWGRFPVDP